MSLDTKKHIGFENILYFLYFFKPRVVGKCGRKDIGGCWKGPKNLLLRPIRAAQKDIMGVRNINIIVGEIILESMEVDNPFDHVLLMFGN
jgi:hypothetical protein